MNVTGITGVLGRVWRADVTGSGAVVPWDGSAPLDWHVAADDRWHSPGAEVSVRQRRLSGTPVFETRLRIPGGDAIHRVWSVANGGGWTVVEVANDSPLPFACAFTHSDLATSRPPTDVPIEGIELPAGTVVLPVGHRAAVTVAMRHAEAEGGGALPGGLATADSVAQGWLTVAARASRLDLPDRGAVDRVTAARCDLLLSGLPEAHADPVAFLLAAGELVRMDAVDHGSASRLASDVAAAAEAIVRDGGWDVDAALDSAALVLTACGEQRAVADLERITARRRAASPPGEMADGIRAIAAVERRLARGPVLFPDGIPPVWRDAHIDAHGLAIGPSTRLSFAVRWHSGRAVVLWELHGDPLELVAPPGMVLSPPMSTLAT